MEVHEIVNMLNKMAINTGTLNCFGCGYEHNCGTHGCAVMREAAEKLEELNTFEQTNRYRLMKKLAEEREKHRWIPVTERLPEEDVSVLAIVSGTPSTNVALYKTIVIAEYFGNEGWFIGEWPDWMDASPDYWMPLPEPYDPEDIEKEDEA